MAALVVPRRLRLGAVVGGPDVCDAPHTVQDLLRVAIRSVRRDDGDRSTTSIEEGQGELVGVVAGKRPGLDHPSRDVDRTRVVLPVRWRVQHPGDTTALRRPEREEPPELVAQPAILWPPDAVRQVPVENGPKCEP